MSIMLYKEFSQIFNEMIFEKSKIDLLNKIAENPNRYIGLFRPTKPKAKILQNLLQSHEIRFGDAFEKIIEAYFKLKGCEILPKKFQTEDSKLLNIDQCFRYENKIYFIEQKVRDDHDSSKKRGQIQNFERKLNIMISEFNKQKIIGIFYFIDPELCKNKNYYLTEIQKMEKDYNIEMHIFYGEMLFEYLEMKDIWDEILIYLEKWKKEIPELPEINFDLNAKHTFEEIKNLKPLVFRKLFGNNDIFNEIILTLFPQQKVLQMLIKHFQKQEESIYKTLVENLTKNLILYNKLNKNIK